MASTSEWLHFHQNTNTNTNNHPSTTAQVASPYNATSVSDLFSGRVSEATVVSTAITPTTNPLQLGPDGRVSKPARRRTRASRRTPTTLLNTDTSNFRAMVQQFTGGPSNTFSPMGNLGQPQHGGFSIGPGLSYGTQFPIGQLQYTTTTTTAMSSSTRNNISTNLEHANNSTNRNMFMQRMGDATLFNTGDNNVNVGLLGGTLSTSSSSENRSSNNSFQF